MAGPCSGSLQPCSTRTTSWSTSVRGDRHQPPGVGTQAVRSGLPQSTVLARVNADPNLTAEEALQDDLNTLLALEKARNKSERDSIAKGIDNSAMLAEVGQMIKAAAENITTDRSALAGKTL